MSWDDIRDTTRRLPREDNWDFYSERTARDDHWLVDRNALRPLVIAGSGSAGPTVSTYNIIDPLSPGTVLSGTKGPIQLTPAHLLLGSRGQCLLAKFATPVQFSKTLRSLIIQLPDLFFQLTGSYSSLFSVVELRIDAFLLAVNYDPVTVNWSNQKFLLTNTGFGGGFLSQPIASASFDNLSGGITAGTCNYDNASDDAGTRQPWLDTSTYLSPQLDAGVISIVNATTFRISVASDVSWLAGCMIAFTAGPPNGSSATIVSSTFIAGTTWEIVTSSATGADTATSFTAWMMLYGIGIGTSGPITTTPDLVLGNVNALLTDPTILIGSR